MPNLIDSSGATQEHFKPIAFISYASPDAEFAKRVAHCLEDIEHLTVFLAPTSIQPGQHWPNEITKNLASCTFFVPVISKHTESAYFQQAEIIRAIDSIKHSQQSRRVIPLILGGSPLPLGLDQFQNLEVNPQDPELWCTQLCNSILSSTMLSGAPYDLDFWRRRLTESNLSLLTDSLAVWLRGASKRRDLIEPSLKLIDLLKECLGNNTEVSYRAHLTHTSRVLTYMQKLCLPRSEGGLDKDRVDFVIQQPEECFLVAFGALFHNLCLLTRLPAMPSDPRGTDYSGRARRFWHRMEYLRTLCIREVDEIGRKFVDQAFRIAREMYRDSPYWQNAAKDEPEGVKDQDNWRALHWNDRTGTIARSLRCCDAFDVGHRIIPDLILHLFDRFGYSDGLACYLQHTFATQKPLLLMGPPELTANGLLIRWADFRDPTNPEKHAIWKAVSLANQIVRDELETIIRHITTEGDVHPNLQVPIRTLSEPCTPTPERMDHVSWALFTLAIAEESSDTNAAFTAAKLIPLLIQYISQIASAITDTRRANKHARGQTESLLRLLPSLRSNSQALQSVVSMASDAIKKTQPRQHVSKIRRAMDKWLGDHPGRGSRIEEWRGQHTEASHFLAYGTSRPAARWLASLTHGRRGEKLTVQPIYCVRRFLLDDSIRPGLQALAPRAEHEAMRLELLEAMSLWKSTEADLEIIEQTIDLRFLPRLAKTELQRRSTEILMGARAFLEDGEGTWSVSIYGSAALSILCKGLALPVRVVTWEDVLRAPIHAFKQDDQPERFAFSYSVTARPGTEDERVPISNLSYITTERRTYTPEEVKEIITSRRGKRGKDFRK